MAPPDRPRSAAGSSTPLDWGEWLCSAFGRFFWRDPSDGATLSGCDRSFSRAAASSNLSSSRAATAGSGPEQWRARKVLRVGSTRSLERRTTSGRWAEVQPRTRSDRFVARPTPSPVPSPERFSRRWASVSNRMASDGVVDLRVDHRASDALPGRSESSVEGPNDRERPRTLPTP